MASLQRNSYPSLARPAITVRNTACRVFPTARPFFLDPGRAGEGFPFDYFQNSALWAGTPLLVTHVSLDGAWFFVEDLLEQCLTDAGFKGMRPVYAGRESSASPATGLAKRHAAEQANLIASALGHSSRVEGSAVAAQ